MFLLILFGSPQNLFSKLVTPRSTSTTPPETKKKNEDNTTAFAIAMMVMVAGFAFVFMEFSQVKLLNEQGAAKNLPNSFKTSEQIVTASPGSEWTDVYVPAGMSFVWMEQHPTEKIWVMIDNDPPFESSAQQNTKLPTKAGPITIHFRAKGQIPVKVKVYLTPNGR